MKSVAGVVACAVLMTACTTVSTASGDRTKLTHNELGTMRPQIAEHLTCMAQSANLYAAGAADLGILVDTAAYTCQSKLTGLSERLKHFNLTSDAQVKYVQAVEMASRSIISERLLKARTQAQSGRDARAGG